MTKNARQAELTRQTRETAIKLSINLDGSGKSSINTGIGFLDHMLELFAKHGFFDLTIAEKGDLIITLGCGDIYKAAHKMIEILDTKEGKDNE